MTPAERALLLAVAKRLTTNLDLYTGKTYRELVEAIAAVEAEDDYHPEMRTFPSDNAHIVPVGNPDFKVQVLGGGGGIGGEPLAEAASLTGGWYSAQEMAEAIRATIADGAGVDDDAALIAAASPAVVLGLLDERDSDECEIERLNELLACFVPGLQTDAINEQITEASLPIMAERDEAREAVRRLAGALEDYANMVPYRITGEALTPTQLRELIEQIARQCEATLADPVVRRIVEGG